MELGKASVRTRARAKARPSSRQNEWTRDDAEGHALLISLLLFSLRPLLLYVSFVASWPPYLFLPGWLPSWFPGWLVTCIMRPDTHSFPPPTTVLAARTCSYVALERRGKIGRVQIVILIVNLQGRQ